MHNKGAIMCDQVAISAVLLIDKMANQKKHIFLLLFLTIN